MSVNKKEIAEIENRIISSLIKNLPENSNHYNIEHEERSNTFKVMEEPNQKQKYELIHLITNTENLKMPKLDV